MKDVISDLHPFASFFYFTCVLAFSMYFTHPVTQAVSLICAIAYSVYLKGRKALSFSSRIMLPMIIIVALINPLFNHQGATILTYFRGGNPLTLESIVYGISSGATLITVICWFSCFNVIITSDKIIYLFGRIIPALSLIFSMTLRFVPRFKAQMLIVSDAQRCVGRDVSTGSIFQRARHGIKILSIMVTWALENAIETADSMKSRGFGLPGRTAFSNFRFDRRDGKVLLFTAVCACAIITGAALGGLSFRYYPTVKGVSAAPLSLVLYAVYTALCFAPVFLNVMEDRKWKALKSAI